MDTLWYTTRVTKILEELGTAESGLSNEEALRRLKESGANTFPEPKVPGFFSIFLSQFASPLIFILAVAAAIVLLMGEMVDGAIILFILFFNAVIGTLQEGKAQNTLAALKKMVTTSATVLRSGKMTIIPDVEVVPGDIVIIQEGEKISADARILFSDSLRVDESSLTGESTPVSKVSEALKKYPLPPQEQTNMVFKGTNAVGGRAKAIVVATGANTAIGTIAEKVSSIETDVPLKKNIRLLSRLIVGIVLAICGGLFVFGIAQGQSIRQMFATVVSLSVSVIPEGLPIVMTVVLASGVWRMVKRNVLVKKLQAVEALGQAKIIAVDKTGTLTKNEMVLTRVYVDGTFFDVEDNGYAPKGDAFLDGKVIDQMNHPGLLLAGRIASFSADGKAIYIEESDTWKVSGDPTEAALDVFAKKMGFKDPGEEAPKTFDAPFDYLTKYHAIIRSFERKNYLAVAGAPETILEMCDRVWHAGRAEKLTKTQKEELSSVFLKMSGNGLRTLAFAFDPNAKVPVKDHEIHPLIFGGFYGLKDPLREEVHDAVARAEEAGIRIVMITGDHASTASAIAREAGILKPEGEVITGSDLEKLSDEELIQRFKNCAVFARVTPEHKMRIIELFRKRGEIVAMTGDGVNDAPSLAAADLGVAMGKIGTGVAKEAADLVLLDDNFGSIISAVEEGRNIYRNIRKVIIYLFSSNTGEVLAIAGAMFLGFPLPVLPAQIIWLNFVTDTFLDVSLGMEPKEDNLLKTPLKKPHPYILNPSSFWRMLFLGTVIAIGTLFVFSKYLEWSPAKATTASLTILAMLQWWNAWNCKHERDSIFKTHPFKNKFLMGATLIVIILQLFAVYNPFMEKVLRTTPLALEDWYFVFLVSLSIVVLEEGRKFIIRTFTSGRKRENGI